MHLRKYSILVVNVTSKRMYLIFNELFKIFIYGKLHVPCFCRIYFRKMFYNWVPFVELMNSFETCRYGLGPLLHKETQWFKRVKSFFAAVCLWTWLNSAHAYIQGGWLPALSNIAPPEIRRQRQLLTLYRKIVEQLRLRIRLRNSSQGPDRHF